ncbi:MAG: phosphate acyltransferase PlsX [Gemmatimonadota bacterium]|nr:phosphate acyltransferase PlsX [Gemmatimonadota bacterium]MDH5758680.1 phosphate acyltransferase PlsX [Gemmatimonadota bacterium]
MRIALDAMGTDHAPVSEVAGAVAALQDLPDDTRIILVGDREVVEGELAKHSGFPGHRIEICHAPDRVTASDAPASVLRRKPESSIVVGLRLQKEGQADAFVSAGSTGAVMATSLFTLRPLPGVDRPAIGTLLPTSHEPCLMLDAGANVDCKPHHLVQFAHLGNIYAQDLMGRAKPRVALLNIGEEPEKGDELTMATHQLLSADPGINFVGNVEGRDIIQGLCDVVVCDGFVGNVLLKFYESVAEFVIGMLSSKLDAAGHDLNFQEVFQVLDYAEYGGAPLLGVGGVSIICHGESTPRAIQNALSVAARAVSTGMVRHVARELALTSENAT